MEVAEPVLGPDVRRLVRQGRVLMLQVRLPREYEEQPADGVTERIRLAILREIDGGTPETHSLLPVAD